MAIWPFRRRAPAPEAPPAAAARLDRVPDPDLDAPEARVPRLRTDGFVDTLAGHGTDRDPRLGMYFLPDLLTEEQEIQIVRGSWLGKRIVGDIVDEAFRPGWELEIGEHAQARAANGDVAGVDEQYAEERKRNVRAAWKRLGVMKALRTALKWERAHGGAAIMLGLDDKQTKPDQKARDTAKLRWLRVIRARDLYPARYYTDPFADKYGEVELWQIVPSSRNGVSGPSPQLFIHESRLIVFGGERVTDTVEQGQLPGFGDGVLMLVVAALRRFASAIDGMEITARRNGEPWWKVKGLPELLALDKGSGFTARLQAKEMARSALKTNVIDSEDDFGIADAPLTGYREVFEILKDELAAAANQPKTVLWGDTPGGIGDGSKGPRQDWYATVAAWAEDHALPPLERITQILMREDGGEPLEWEIELCPLWEASEKEEAEIEKLEADTDVALVAAQIVAPSQAAQRERWRKRFNLPEMGDALDPAAIPDDIRDPGADPNAPPPVDGGAPPPAGEPVQATALNGAQMAGLLGIVRAVTAGEVPREAAIEIVLASVPSLSREQATRMIGPEDFKATPKPVPPAFGAPAAPPPAKPEEPAPDPTAPR